MKADGFAPWFAILVTGVLVTSHFLGIEAVSADWAVSDASGALLADSTRLRVGIRNGGIVTGRGLATHSDTLTLVADPRGDTLRLPFASISALKVERGKQSHFWAGLGIGAGLGAVIGALAGYAGGDDPVDQTCILCNITRMTAGEKAAGGAAAGALLGATAGGLVGLTVRTPRFVPIARESLRVTLRGGPDGSVRLGLTTH